MTTLERVKKRWKWFRCPECGDIWSWGTNSGQKSDNDFYNTQAPKNVKISEEKLCPNHDERIICGRRKGGFKGVDLKKADLNNGIRCPVCGSKDLDLDPEIYAHVPYLYEYICQVCNSYFIIVQYPDSICINYASYREDLQTKEFNETVEEILDILKTEGIEIKKGRRLK